ncbi:uncharacterized protein LOC131332410 [Rhododendron vialii]|uniref:uncharacterized protein LOC131332410 n=1 Tax=Rhododendron vialii TaxID=182163 RepID=UPI00265F525C|nr:uncharacterized protein LOC131332410 [Rhododendron vialii]
MDSNEILSYCTECSGFPEKMRACLHPHSLVLRSGPQVFFTGVLARTVIMVKKTIDSFFKRRSVEQSIEHNTTAEQSVEHNTTAELLQSAIGTSTIEPQTRPLKTPRVEVKEFDSSSLIRDPGLRRPIRDYPTSERDEVRRAYLTFGPYQPEFPKDQYPKDGNGRRFLPSWYKLYLEWLEYSPTKNCAYCLPCHLFAQESRRPGYNAFVDHRFSKWKKVNNSMRCPFAIHMGKDLNSCHRCALGKCHDLLNQAQHIEKVVEKQTSEQVAKNRLRLKTSIDAVKWLTLHNCALRGRDESSTSSNRGNCIDLIELLASYNPDVDKVINGGKFCIIVDESQDESNREQMAIVLRFVDKDGLIQERFFDIVHVLNTASATLKEHICTVLACHSLSVQNIRGQGYDGASNMRGRWKGLQALFLNDCPFAYYVHCFAHRLQLALVAASKEVISVKNFFSYVTLIVNIIDSSPKKNDQFRGIQAAEIAEKLAVDDDELETGKGNNRIRKLKRAGDTRWGSHFGSISSLMSLFSSTCLVLKEIINDKDSTSTQRAEADGAYDAITTFEFCGHAPRKSRW